MGAGAQGVVVRCSRMGASPGGRMGASPGGRMGASPGGRMGAEASNCCSCFIFKLRSKFWWTCTQVGVAGLRHAYY